MRLGYWNPIQGLVIERPERIIVIKTEASDDMKAITPDELFQLHEELCSEALEVMRRKNQDYSQSTSGGRDVFKNFRGAEIFGVAPEVGLMIRMNDKFQRVHSFIMAGQLAVAEEGIRDLAVDSINYAVLLYGLLEERKRKAELEDTVGVYYDGKVITKGDVIRDPKLNYEFKDNPHLMSPARQEFLNRVSPPVRENQWQKARDLGIPTESDSPEPPIPVRMDQIKFEVGDKGEITGCTINGKEFIPVQGTLTES